MKNRDTGFGLEEDFTFEVASGSEKIVHEKTGIKIGDTIRFQNDVCKLISIGGGGDGPIRLRLAPLDGAPEFEEELTIFIEHPGIFDILPD